MHFRVRLEFYSGGVWQSHFYNVKDSVDAIDRTRNLVTDNCNTQEIYKITIKQIVEEDD